ncbi:MAG: PIG-L family deacetylase [Dehalococcoidia bacterium]|nr:PIG-L family deacetylase [Dehalococcoidia bacterium]
MNALCFQPHNDDCAIAIGGVLQKMVRHGWEITYVYVTDGCHGSDTITPARLVEVRKKEAEKERRLLGVGRFFDLGVEDGTAEKLSSIQRKWVNEQLESILLDAKADLILCPSRADMHPDHRATHDLVLAAVEKLQPHPLIVKYFVWLFPDFYRKLPDPVDQVLMVGVDREMTGKMAAIRAHQSQVSRGSFDSMVQVLNAYLAYAFRAPVVIGSRYVEVIGVYQPHLHRRVTSELLRAVEPCTDITTMLHGRTSQDIRA